MLSIFPLLSAGTIRIHYQVLNGNLRPLAADQRLAYSGMDFIGGHRSVEIASGDVVGQIPVWLLDDDTPELEEVFLVNITGVELVNSSQAGNTVPKLGNHTVSQITIPANDGTRGLLHFSQGRYV